MVETLTHMAKPACLSLIALGLSGCTYFVESLDDVPPPCPTVKIPDNSQPFDTTAKRQLQRLIDRDSNRKERAEDNAAFVRLNEQGVPLNKPQAIYDNEPWACVSDNRTDLTWEVKTNNLTLRDMRWTYTWYAPLSTDKNGYAGMANGGKCHEGNACDTQAYIAAVNAEKLCGYDDWRLPQAFELHTILEATDNCPGTCINLDYFPNTAKGAYWTSSPFDEFICYAWGIDFELGATSGANKHTPLHVRLVRGKWIDDSIEENLAQAEHLKTPTEEQSAMENINVRNH